MSKFKYIFELETGPHRYMSGDEALKAEQAYQLRRIADALEGKLDRKPNVFWWNFNMWERSYIIKVEQVFERAHKKKFEFQIHCQCQDKTIVIPYEYHLQAEAEDARAEFIKRWRGEQ